MEKFIKNKSLMRTAAVFFFSLVVIFFSMITLGKSKSESPKVLGTINPDSITGDVDGDGDVDMDDMLLLLKNYLQGDGNSGDLTNDGKVNVLDFGKLVILIGQSQPSPTPRSSPRASPTIRPTPRVSPSPTPAPSGIDVYGTFIMVPKDQVTNATVIRQELDTVKTLGANVVGQIFSGTSTESDWRTFADLVQQAGMKFVPFIRDQIPIFNTTTNTWDLGIHGRFLTTMKNHPALYAMFVYDEPHRHGVRAIELAILYQQAKALAPSVQIGVGFSGEIWRAETGQYGASSPEFAFRQGLCDLCMISGLEFRINPNTGQREYQRQDAVDNHTVSRTVIAREAPNVEVWSTVQTFGGGTYYMPSPVELQDLIDLILSNEIQAIRALEGLNYQTWADPEPGQSRESLGDTQFGALRDIVRATAIRLGLPVP